MAELILAEQEFPFTKNMQDDIHCSQVNTLELTTGITYTVIWDDELWVCTAEDVELEGMSAVAIGDKSIEGIGADTEEPFLIGYSADYGLALIETLEKDETHTVTIYEGVLEEIKGANIVLYDRNGEPVIYNGIETVSFNTDDGEIATYTHGTATDEVAVALDLSAGNQTVTPADADFMKKVVIEKPANLVPSNIRKNEVVAGVVGELIGEGVSKEVELSLADGDQTVEPDPDTLMSKIIIKKPESLRPENIAKDENVAGVVGTLIGGAVYPSDINFYDYDGTIVASWTLEELASATELPANPEHEGLISQGWNWALNDLKTANRAMNVGQMYITDDGKTRLYIRIAVEGRMNVPLYFSQTVENGVTIDWGDGSATETVAGTGNVTKSHTYASVGDYVVTLLPVDECALGFHSSSNYSVFGAVSNGKAYCNMLRRVELGANVTSIVGYALYHSYNLTSITIPKGVTTFGSSAFDSCYNLKSVTLPDTITTIGTSVFQKCYSLESISIPMSITDISASAFYYCYSLKSVTLPDTLTTIGSSAFNKCYSLEYLDVPRGVTSLGSNCFSDCYNLKSVTLPDTLTTIGGSVFQGCSSLTTINIPDGITSLPGMMLFYQCVCLVGLTFPSGLTAFTASNAFTGCTCVGELHFKSEAPPSLGSNTLTGIPTDCIIYVPKGCLSAYKAATNWSTYASYMQEETE